MDSAGTSPGQSSSSWVQERILLGMTFREYLRSLWTPFNVVCAAKSARQPARHRQQQS
jgi:hypothetical protein